jgi:hypothetical protein
MKGTFNTYISVVLILLLGTFAYSKADSLTSNTIDTCVELHNDALELLSESFISDSSNAKTYYNPIQDKRNQHNVFDIFDSEEVENEESSSHQTDDNKELNTAFINAKVFDGFSKELQKNILRVSCNVKTPNTRLHLLHQVFII